MKLTRKQKKREEVAVMLDKWVGKNQTSKQLRATNRRVDKRKGKSK